MTTWWRAHAHMSSVTVLGHLDMAWSRIILARKVIVPIKHSAIPFCQWAPMAQNAKFCYCFRHASLKSWAEYTPLSALTFLMRTLNLSENCSTSASESTNSVADLEEWNVIYTKEDADGALKDVWHFVVLHTDWSL